MSVIEALMLAITFSVLMLTMLASKSNKAKTTHMLGVQFTKSGLLFYSKLIFGLP